MNPRYLNYCRINGRTPEAQLAHDVERWPGGKMCGFIVWISEQWSAWGAEHGRKRDDIKGPADHASFDARLEGLAVIGGAS